MFENLSRHTLISKKDGSVFLIKCKVKELHSMEKVTCYLGLQYCSEDLVDYLVTRCYTEEIDYVIEETN